MKEQTNERMYTMTKHITTLLLRSRVKIKFQMNFRYFAKSNSTKTEVNSKDFFDPTSQTF